MMLAAGLQGTLERHNTVCQHSNWLEVTVAMVACFCEVLLPPDAGHSAAWGHAMSFCYAAFGNCPAAGQVRAAAAADER